MSTVDVYKQLYKYNRTRTLDLLANIEKLAEPLHALLWRPGTGRAHIGWQLLHVGVTEELFATERLAPHKRGAFQELWPRFRSGSTPGEELPSIETIHDVLSQSRTQLFETLAEFGDERLGEMPTPFLEQRGWTVATVLDVIGWHEAHHQGQAHITLNLYKAARA